MANSTSADFNSPRLSPAQYCVLCWIYQLQINNETLVYNENKLPSEVCNTINELHRLCFVHIGKTTCNGSGKNQVSCTSETIKMFINNQVFPTFKVLNKFDFIVAAIVDGSHQLKQFPIYAHNINHAYELLSRELKEFMINPLYWEKHIIKQTSFPSLPYVVTPTLELIKQ